MAPARVVGDVDIAAVAAAAGGKVVNRAILQKEFNLEHPEAACEVGIADVPSAGDGQVVVKMLCRPINPSDVFCLQGVYPPWMDKLSQFPNVVPGIEGMGIIHQIGDDVTELKVGQRVFPFLDGGSWQEYVTTSAQAVVPIPDYIADEIAAQFLVNPWTAYGMIKEVKVPKGKYLLQTAAGSVLGRMVIQLAREQGIKTINLVRRDGQKEELKAIGADEVINYSKENVLEEVKRITGGELAYAAIECVGGPLTNVVGRCVRNSGIVILYGAMDALDAHVDILDIIFRQITVRGYHLTAWILKMTPLELQEVASTIFSLLEKKVIEIYSGEKFPLEKFREAIIKSRGVARGGKVLLVNN